MAKDKRKGRGRAAKHTLNRVTNQAAFKHITGGRSASKRNQHVKSEAAGPSIKSAQQQRQQAVMPVNVFDRILLVGDGNFSFASSLVLDHGVSDLLATSYDSHEEVLRKYGSDAASHIASVNDAFDHSLNHNNQTGTISAAPVMYGVDATKLDKNKHLQNRAPFTRIIFNFPHTGGIYTDVNRQVRANQALLSAFFHACRSLLSTAPPDMDMQVDMAPSPPSILVTLFEGEPYTLWNIRDLARSADLVVARSFRFAAELYPRYRHARTAGVIRKGGENGVQESDSAWKGEERLARTYELRQKDDIASAVRPEIESEKADMDGSSSDG